MAKLVALFCLVLVAASTVPKTDATPVEKSAKFDANSLCPAEDVSPIYFTDPSDCTVFYQCANGIAYRQDCSVGLVFNPNVKVCDFPPEGASCY